MPLRITLKPNERLIINGALIRNLDRSSAFIIETQCKFLREGEIIHESDADTPCKKLAVTLQVIHLSEDQTDTESLFYLQAIEIMKELPDVAKFISAIQTALSEKNTYKAIKIGKDLINHERELEQKGFRYTINK